MQASKAAALSIFSNSAVVLLKFIVGVITGSVAVISEAIHSSLDLVASIIAFFSVRFSSQPPDKNHPFGHGKIENLSGTIETVLIFVAGIWIMYEAFHKLFHPSEIRLPWLGILVMLLGATVNFVVGKIVKSSGEKIESVAMRSNALHLLTDALSSLGVAASLLIVSLTDLYFLDPLIAILIAVYIIVQAWKLGKESFLPLLDIRLSKEEEILIIEMIESFKSEYIEYHDLRTRRSGSEKHIDFHLVLPSTMTIAEAHELCDRIELKIGKVLLNPHVVIHIEPEHEKCDPSLS